MIDLVELDAGVSLPDKSGRHVVYRYWQPTDDAHALTALLHEAYAPLAAAGMRFVASHQDAEMTKRRLAAGDTIVAVDGGLVIGAITFNTADATSGSPFYDRPEVAHFGQFAVHPSRQGNGIGSTLLSLVEQRATALGVPYLALDTSEHARDLIRFYESRGFHFVEHHRWDTVNYRSVVLAKRLKGSTA